MTELTQPAKQLLLASLLAQDRIISNNGKAFLKELILRRDPRLASLLRKFESKEAGDSLFLEQIHELIQDEAMAVYNELFVDTSLEVGKTLSKGERDQKQLNDEKSLIYGEVEFQSFYRVLRKINPQPGLVFYDLGSGTGKAVFVARFTQDFARCLGIEILHGLHTQALKVVDRYNREFRSVLCAGQNQHASVHEGSILDVNWLDGDVVFANSTCFDDDLMKHISTMAEGLKPGAIVVTFTKGLSSKAFEVLERKRYKMSWGPATVFIHRRLQHDGRPVGPIKLNTLPSDDIEYDDDDDEKKPLKKAATAAATASKYADYSNKHYDYEDDDEDEDDEDDDDTEGDDDDDDDEDEDEDEDDEDDEDDDDEDDDEDDYDYGHTRPPLMSAYYPQAPKVPSPLTKGSPPKVSTPPSAGKSNFWAGSKAGGGPGPLPPPPGTGTGTGTGSPPYSYKTMPSPPKTAYSAASIPGEDAPSPYRPKTNTVMTSPSALRARNDAVHEMNSPQDSALLHRKAMIRAAASRSGL